MKIVKKKRQEHGPVFAGIDLGNAHTGVSIFDKNGVCLKTFVFSYSEKNFEKLKRQFMLSDVLFCKANNFSLIENRAEHFKGYVFYHEILRRIFFSYGVTFAFFEGYAYGAYSRAITRLAELGSIAKMVAIEREVKWLEVSPQSVKKFVTGKGNGPKEVVLRAVYKKYGVEFEDIKGKEQLDAADSYVIGKMCYWYYNIESWGKLKSYEREVMEKIKESFLGKEDE